jgi:hypothetical protein
MVFVPLGLAALSALSTWFVLRKRGSSSDGYDRFRLRNRAGMTVEVCAVGAAIVRLSVPDAKGRKADVVLGYDHADDYLVRGWVIMGCFMVIALCDSQPDAPSAIKRRPRSRSTTLAL